MVMVIWLWHGGLPGFMVPPLVLLMLQRVPATWLRSRSGATLLDY